MKIHFKYNFDSVVPDEIDYLFSIVNQVCDYFFHEDINFYITNDINLSLETKNNIVFLSGCEKNSKLRDNNFKLCFNNFYRDYCDNRYIPLPLGNNKFVNKNLLKYESTNFQKRKYDIFFAGFIHPNRINFKNKIESLNCKKFIHYTQANNLQNFDNNLNPEEYLNILNDSKIILAPAGAHHSTSYRYFESIYFQNIVFFEKRQGEEIFIKQNFNNHYEINDWNTLSEDIIFDAIKNFNLKSCKENYKKIFSKHSVITLIINKILEYDI